MGKRRGLALAALATAAAVARLADAAADGFSGLTRVSVGDRYHDDPVARCMSDGSCVAVLEAEGDRRIFTRHSTDMGATWGSPVELGGGSVWDARIGCVEGATDQLCVAAWTDDNSVADERMFYSRSQDGGRSWSSPSLLAMQGLDDINAPDVACGMPAGAAPSAAAADEAFCTIVGIAEDNSNNDVVFALKLTDGATTSDGVAAQLCKSGLGQKCERPRVYCSPRRGTCVSSFGWRIGKTIDEIQVRTTFSDDGGETWADAQQVPRSSRHIQEQANNPLAEMRSWDSDVWCADDTGVCLVAVDSYLKFATSYGTRWVEVARSTDNGATFAAPRVVADVSWESFFSEVAVGCTAAGQCVVGWRHPDRVEPQYSISGDAGLSWGAPTEVDVPSGLITPDSTPVDDVHITCVGPGGCLMTWTADALNEVSTGVGAIVAAHYGPLPLPTTSPTTSPTLSPSVSPVAAPTLSPIVGATASPTLSPSAAADLGSGSGTDPVPSPSAPSPPSTDLGDDGAPVPQPTPGGPGDGSADRPKGSSTVLLGGIASGSAVLVLMLIIALVTRKKARRDRDHGLFLGKDLASEDVESRTTATVCSTYSDGSKYTQTGYQQAEPQQSAPTVFLQGPHDSVASSPSVIFRVIPAHFSTRPVTGRFDRSGPADDDV